MDGLDAIGRTVILYRCDTESIIWYIIFNRNAFYIWQISDKEIGENTFHNI